MHEVVQAGGNAEECNGEHEEIGTHGKADVECPPLTGQVAWAIGVGMVSRRKHSRHE
jgi:hypothetical protein